MNKLFMTACVAAFASVALTGCLQELPKTRSVGLSLMPSPVMHRANGDDEHSYLSLTGDGYYGHTGVSEENIKNVNIGGANVSATYNFGGFFSPLFVNAAVGFFGGYSGFACSGLSCSEDDGKKAYDDDDILYHEDSPSGPYRSWLESSEGRDTYSTWASQERIVIGFDFTPGPYVIWGFSLGLQWYQEGGDYYKKRNELENHGYTENLDDSSEENLLASIWLGSHLGRNGEYGNFVVQYELGSLLDNSSYRIMFTYTHPSGFFIGYQYGSVVSHSFYFGKEFVF